MIINENMDKKRTTFLEGILQYCDCGRFETKMIIDQVEKKEMVSTENGV